MQYVDVIIVGAGPAGIGMAVELKYVEGLRFAVLEGGCIGESFLRWPTQTRFITPSFYSNPFGMADLNAIDAMSSPALFAGAEHLSGPQYAEYLAYVAHATELPVATQCKVLQVNPEPDYGFHVVTELGELLTQVVIWASGEYQFPDLNPFPGGQYCQHYAQIADWQGLQRGHYTVIGGYESGLDAAINLLKLGSEVRLLVRRRTWDLPDVNDPSRVLSPHTRGRLREVEKNKKLEIIYDADVVEVTRGKGNGFSIRAADGRCWDTNFAPILGTGFIKGGGACQIEDLWAWDDEGNIVLNEQDESTCTPGLFLVGPHVRHEQAIYCFVYKFRQRFERIAREVADRLQLNFHSPETVAGGWGPFGNSECCEDCEC